jgi:hypothetical protein
MIENIITVRIQTTRGILMAQPLKDISKSFEGNIAKYT